MLDTKALAAATAEIVKDHVERATAPLLERIAQLEARPSAEAGKDGASVTLADVAPLVAQAVERAVAGIPAPKDGLPGQDGATVQPEVVERMVSAAVDRAVGSIPAPRDGADGIGLAGAIIDRSGSLVVTLTNGETRNLGEVVGKDGRDGVDGKDGKDGEAGPRGERGFDLEAFDTELQADGRTILLKFTAGDTIETHELQFPVVIYRGVFKEGTAYEAGDEVTWAGSAWHCIQPTTEKPGEGSKAWSLKVKRGRDGKDGLNGERGLQGPEGKAGRDLTQVGLDGRKW